MSKETMEWLNTMTLIGYTDQRGNAWHYREEDQGAEPNHYPGAIPVGDVLRRLFNFEVFEAPVFYLVNGEYVESKAGRKGMLTSDSLEDLGAFKSGYQGHAYKDWLLDNVSTILDDELGIGSAGLLRNRGQAWVSVEVPDSITTPEGVEFRPNLMACTSFDGSLATTYKRVVTVTVCDNTLAAALSEGGQTYKLKHTRYSNLKLTSAREALAIVHTMGEEFAAQVAALTEWKVTEKQFEKLLGVLVPMPEEEGRGYTMAEKKQEEILHLYRADERCAPWQGTAWGVLQSYNTWAQHFQTVKGGVPRVVRNMENVVTDKLAGHDQNVLVKLNEITKHSPKGKGILIPA